MMVGKTEKPETLRDRLVKEWVKANKPSIGERMAYWAGYHRGFECGINYMHYYRKSLKRNALEKIENKSEQKK